MRPITPVLGCLILTAVVVHTCIRIEVLNASSGFYLPRKDHGDGNRKWRVASEKATRLDIERRIAIERQENLLPVHPGSDQLLESSTAELPYTAMESEMIASALDESRCNSALRDWVSSVGILQYLLAPAALLWSVQIAITNGYRRQRILGAACGALNLICVALMFFRGYWSSLSW